MVTQNRYKLSKKYRKLLDEHGPNPDGEAIQRQLKAAKVSNPVCYITDNFICAVYNSSSIHKIPKVMASLHAPVVEPMWYFVSRSC